MLPEDEQAEIAKRRTICATCPFSSSNAVKEFGYVHNRIDEHCILCGCSTDRKTASLSSECAIGCCNHNATGDCGCKQQHLKQFNDLNKINIELKWKAYKTKENGQEERQPD